MLEFKCVFIEFYDFSRPSGIVLPVIITESYLLKIKKYMNIINENMSN